ncbi:sigma-54-dependent Fis family transcriptional regulator [Virgibacillus alimentarius]|uniref:sigma-54-dependent Fis family transcriptional regulator n=1 Tax=Virgibacillus alimentarius TaxID=698769 RepID=UPI0018DDE553|nr:sigma-54-dependent Fis family transcriptional regulator [Virgibacillus alimentarius]
MKKNTIIIDERTEVNDALKLLAQKDINEVPVTKDEKIIGVFHLKNYIQALQNAAFKQTDVVTKWMSETYRTVSENESMFKIAETPTYVTDETQNLIGVVDESARHSFCTQQNEKIKSLEETIKWYELSFNTAYEGLAVVDKQGVIQIFNEAYSRYVGVSQKEAVGRPADTVIDGTRLPVVLQTGVPERSQAHRLQGHNLVVHRLPIWKNNEVVGAVGMLVYEGVSEIYQVIERMEQLDRGMQYVKQKLDSKLKVSMKDKVRFEDILGDSQVISQTKKLAIKASKTKATVFISGESGVGKEQFANAIHDMGVTAEGKFVSVNCASIPENLIESELFGYEEGTFTGAKPGGKIGKFELADGGTLFLDEIGEMPLNIQAKILRVLQERKVYRIGAHDGIPVDIRIIAATNKNLKQMVKEGDFREDLFYRLYVIPIHIPPLRIRREDIPPIVAHKLQELSKKYHMEEKTIDKKLLSKFNQYDWPGNVRELTNVLERLFVLSEDQHITNNEFSNILFPENEMKTPKLIFDQQRRFENMEEQMSKEEKQAILSALEKTDGNKSQAAKILNISRATLYNKLTRFKIN